jgi:opacity protein-like surface antigen
MYVALLFLASLLLLPSSARADGYVTPWIGVNFAGSTDTTLANSVEDNSMATYGASVGFMGGGIIGIEGDFGYAPKFVAAGAGVGQTNVFTAMGNVIVGIPVGGQRGGGFRPYFVGGIGLLRTNVEQSLAALEPDRNAFGFDVGGGANIYFADHVGIRGDVRYFRQFSAADSNNAIGIVLGKGTLDFWRGTVGLVLRF